VIESDLPVLYANQLGGQDELVFDGASFAFNADRKLAFQMSQFEDQVVVTTWRRGEEGWFCDEGPMSRIPEGEEADYRACMLGLRDYVNKNGFKSVVLGLSGGIDSAICAALAVDALGEERLHAIMLPYSYTSSESLTDAENAPLLGCRYDVVPIREPVEGFMTALSDMFHGTNEGITEENLQSRTRGTILMAISNKFGSMVVTTGNKSEMSVGYATLYGDMNGGFNPIKDLYKMQVYALARWRNAHTPPGALGPTGMVIPQNIIDKAPSAELASRPDRPGLAAALSGARRYPRKPGRTRDVCRRHRRARPRPRAGPPHRASALYRRIQAPPVGAGREDHSQEFRPRPALSDHQPVPRPDVIRRGAYRGLVPVFDLSKSVRFCDQSTMSFFPFLRDNSRWLAGGFLLTFFASYGQNFYVALSSGGIREDLALSHGEFGGLYMFATLASAATIPFAGRLADKMPIERYAALVLLGLGGLHAAARQCVVGGHAYSSRSPGCECSVRADEPDGHDGDRALVLAEPRQGDVDRGARPPVRREHHADQLRGDRSACRMARRVDDQCRLLHPDRVAGGLPA
jgi:NAD+ synthetase